MPETNMQKPERNMDDVYNMALCLEDWQRIIQALRDQAFAFMQDSQLAHTKGAQDYCELLWEETAKSNALADYLYFGIPEVE